MAPDETNVEDKKLAKEEEKSAGVVSVLPLLLDSPVVHHEWVGTDKMVIFLITERHTLFKSIDGGQEWTSQTAKLDSTKGVVAMHVSPSDPSVILFRGTDKENWLTRDMGKTYTALSTAHKFDEVAMHPHQAAWILAAAMSPECNVNDGGEGAGEQHAPAAPGPNGEPAPKPPGCNRHLFLTQDFGKTWTQLLTYVVQFAWAPRGHLESTVFATVHNTKSDRQNFGVWNPDVDLISSTDFFKTHKTVVAHGNRILFNMNFVFVALVHPDEPTTVKLMVNRDNVTTTLFEPIKMPVELVQHSFTILDSSEGSVFLHIDHQGNKAKLGMIYSSDASGSTYALSLPNNRRATDGRCDFEKVDGVEGIYLANFIEEVASTAPVEDGMDQHTDRPAPGPAKHHTKTVITFDKGGEWSFLRAPETDLHGHPVQCQDSQHCNLNLFGITGGDHGPFYSTATAVGLLMGTGNVGAHLDESFDAVNTYLSRDAGLTWFEVAKGSHIYEMGNHGGLLLMANNHAATDTILYSVDEGLTWRWHKISDTPIHIENIVIEKTATSQIFLILGRVADAGVVIQLDFRGLHERPCRGADTPNTAESDYETWSPSDGRTRACLLGHTTTFVRRKRDHACYHHEEHKGVVTQEHCPCTDLDFECDYGFRRESTPTGENGRCVPDEASPQFLAVGTAPKPPPRCDGFWLATRGYRRVAGDTCVGGDDYLPIVTPCPASGLAPSSGFGFVLLIILLIGAIALGVVVIGGKHEPIRDFIAGVRGKFSDVSYGAIGGGGPHAAVGGGSRHVPDSMDDDFGLDEDGRSAEPYDDEASVEFHKATAKKFSPLPGAQKGGKNVDDDDDFDPRA